MTKTNKPIQNDSRKEKKLRVGLVVPHIFMQDELLHEVIFSPGNLALELADNLVNAGIDVYLFSPGKVKTKAINETSDLSYFKHELAMRGYGYIELLKKHPLSFVSLSRQVQSELVAKAYLMANADNLDIVHIYTNEEDIALPFSALCDKPVLFTHHDPFNFLITYRNNFPKYKDVKWISISYAQRNGMPEDTNWVGNVYHGLDPDKFRPIYKIKDDYVTYVGRIIESKGVHLAILAIKKFNKTSTKKFSLRIAGKHYAGHKKDSYWSEIVEPLIDGKEIIYEGFLDFNQKLKLISGATAMLMPSLFEEPFGLSAIEAMACGTPVITLNSGALPEIIKQGMNGLVVDKKFNDDQLDIDKTVDGLAEALSRVNKLDRQICRKEFEARFTVQRMSSEYASIYQSEHDKYQAQK